MHCRITIAITMAVCLAAVAFGQLRERPVATRAGAFRVTAWPEHKTGIQGYFEEVEEHLNKMATDGWRFHSEMTGQFGRMMVFERAGEK